MFLESKQQNSRSSLKNGNFLNEIEDEEKSGVEETILDNDEANQEKIDFIEDILEKQGKLIETLENKIYLYIISIYYLYLKFKKIAWNKNFKKRKKQGEFKFVNFIIDYIKKKHFFASILLSRKKSF